jgi:bifunctional N-acetylglucosamine-1-phosphate-uridyltransferase/glucosamine-1-phosphate-acetyltransferase GlmU-like protein
MKTISRKTAVVLGLVRYFTGKKCKHGHVSERFVSSFSCIECLNTRNNTASYKENRQNWFLLHKEEKRLYDVERKKAKPRNRKGERQNPAVKARRKAAKLQRIPKWLTPVDFERIQNEYRLAELQTLITKEPWHVDHVIPLQGKLVSGLHVPSNLQAIRAVENMRKHNKWEPA